MGIVCLGDLVNLKTSVNKVAVGMDDTFTVIASQLGCINGMLVQ
jgi:hypothetical protein